MINNRTKSTGATGCPGCSERQVVCVLHQSVAGLYPKLLEELHPKKKDSVDLWKLRPGSNLKVWWLCSQKHCTQKDCHAVCEWQAMICSRTKANGTGCPACAHQRLVCLHQSVGYLFPRLVAEFHPTKNESLDLFSLFPGTRQKVWWRCEMVHCEQCGATAYEWSAELASRTSKEACGCSACAQTILFCREHFYPELEQEFHPTLPGLI